MHFRRRLRKILFWSTAVLLASLSGGIWFAYVYVTDSETIARLVRTEAPRYLPGSRVELSRAKIRLFIGEVNLEKVMLRQVIDGKTFLTGRVPWLNIRHDPWLMLEGKFEPSEVVAAMPTLRLRRRGDGTWNLQGLLASPWPGPMMKTPPIIIQNGTVELAGDDDPQTPAVAILRDVSVRIESVRPAKLKFEGTAKGDTFDRLSVRGTVDITTGRVELAGDLARLTISEPLRGRIPAEFRPIVNQLGLTSGEVDLKFNRVTYDPATDPTIHYDIAGHLHAGVLTCPKLPFPLNDLTAGFAVRDGVLTLERAKGYYGTTTVRVERGLITLGDPERVPIDLALEIIDVELDRKLHDWTPERFQGLWDEFRPSGRLSVAAAIVRRVEGGPIERRVTIDCRDVAMLYKYFPYPLDHVSGRFVWEGDRIELQGLSTLVGGQPLTARGTIESPGDRAVVRLEFTGQALPIDKTLFDALPADIREVVDQFKPTGTVRGRLSLLRTPPDQPEDDPRGKVAIDAWIDLNERCGMRWDNLPYPVNNLTGRLELHPDLWEFKEMRGSNGQAVITGSGRVEKLPGPGQQLRVDLHLNAEKLPFDDQLRASLPEAWRKSWAILDPTGSSDVDATIKVRPGTPDSYLLVVTPRPATSVRLRYSRTPKPGIDPGGTFELPMEHVTGRFVFDNGPVDMHDVGFQFHDAPVRFARGRVIVEDSGKFQLGVSDLYVKNIRLDSRLRAIMPPVMAQFAQRLDNGKTFTSKGNLALGWSGVDGAPVWCRWDKTLVVFDDNAVQIQPELSLEHIQGQLDNVRGWTDGETFDVHGALQLASVSLLGQQITRLESPIDIDHGVARLDSLRGNLLGGALTGKLSVTLADTPRYSAELAVRGAELEQYAFGLQGHRPRGKVDARLALSGLGGNLRTLHGNGEARVVNGDLGELPIALRLMKYLTLSPANKTAFDSADVALTIQNGKSYFDPIRFTGNAFSLRGRGTMDVQGALDMRLNVIYGRDRLHVKLFSDALREASGQFLVVRVTGTPSYPKFKLDPLPELSEGVKSVIRAKDERDGGGGRR